MSKILPREPWRGSQICGWQTAYGMPWDEFCGEKKADGYYLCEKHWQELEESGDSMAFPEDVALGAHWKAPRLLWEPQEGDVPIEPSFEEMSRYAAAQRGGE